MQPVDNPSTLLEQTDPLTWDDIYPIARTLNEQHPGLELANVSYQMIFQWTIELPAFFDDPNLWNESILAAIYQEWFEEVNP